MSDKILARASLGKFVGEFGGVGGLVTVKGIPIGKVVEIRNDSGNVEITFEVDADNAFARRWLGNKIGNFSIDIKE